MAKLTPNKQNLIKTLKSDVELWRKFKRLVDFEGLWDAGVNIGSFGNASSLQLKPQLMNFLDSIYNFWSAFPPDSADVSTVQALDLRCLGVYKDREILERHYDSGSLFSKLGPQTRALAKDVLFNSRVALIPTIGAMYRNLVVLGRRVRQCPPFLSQKKGKGVYLKAETGTALSI